MKKIALLVFFISIHLAGFAQSKEFIYNRQHKYAHKKTDDEGKEEKNAKHWYLRAGLGYAFRQAGQTLNENSDPYTGTQTFDTTHSLFSYSSLKKVSFSAGLQAVLAGGYMFSKNVGVEVDGYLGMASSNYTSHFNNVLVNGSFPADITVTNKALSPVFIAPCAVFQIPGNVISGYARAGIAIPVNGKVIREENYHFYPPGYGSSINNITLDYNITTSFSLGYTAAMGIKYSKNKHFSYWTEASMLSLSLNIKQITNTKNVADGQTGTTLPTVSYGFNGTNVDRNNQVGTQPSYAEPFSNIAINAGMAINF